MQGYVYAAYLARAYLAHQTGDDQRARYWTERAADLKKAFNERFWQPELGYYAVALDHEKKPVDACTSNMGHCLWSGIVDEDKAPYVADRLLSPTMFSGWGIRTLATDMGAYDPVSYHNGSVWPHDNAIIASGLMRYGFTEHAQRVATALFEAAEHFGYRLPELFCGFDRTDYPKPVPYPHFLLSAGLGGRNTDPPAADPAPLRPVGAARGTAPRPQPAAGIHPAADRTPPHCGKPIDR